MRPSALAILTADCASVALGSAEGVFGAVHAGWRGLLAGVVEATVAAMRARGAGDVVGALGPCIHPECYEFSDADLDAVAAAYGRRRARAGRRKVDRRSTSRPPWPPLWLPAAPARWRAVVLHGLRRRPLLPPGPGRRRPARPWWCGRLDRSARRAMTR